MTDDEIARSLSAVIDTLVAIRGRLQPALSDIEIEQNVRLWRMMLRRKE